MKVTSFGLHLNVPMDEYVADTFHKYFPALSSGVARALLDESPLHAWTKHPQLNPCYKPEESNKMDLGTISHAIILQGDVTKIAVVNAKDWRTKEAQTKRDAARADGLIPVLTEQMNDIEAMVEVANEAISKSELADLFKPDDGDSEVTLLWEDQGVICKARPDRVSKDRRILVDYKTTAASAEPTAWSKGPMLTNGCDIQAAMGLRGIKAVCPTLKHDPKFVFIVQETEPPYAVSFVGFGMQFEHYADVRLDRAIKVWQRCITSKHWPGYPTRTAWVAPPPYKMAEWEAQVEEMDRDG
jgi:hypothetical protein